MKNRTDAFNTGGYAQDETSEPMDHVSNRSKIKEANKKGVLRRSDGLYNALSAPAEMYRATKKANLPTDNHRWEHTSKVRPRGAHYSPAGQFGRTARTGAGRGVYSYGGNMHSARPSHAVPGNQNSRSGDNAVGHAPDRKGGNANMFPRIPNRSGTNAVGNPPNRIGENALASRFAPKGGFHGGARRS